ncbi:MAG: 50S ribosomal protein L4 [Kiritimatiellae bacterium]|nr:50S ribosomal protein L4 [Kiritimatiellia bacterium]
MSKLPLKSAAGDSKGEYELSDELLIFNKGLQVLHDAVVAYNANQRAGTASTLTKGEVSGSNAKPWRQKGTGRARVGTRRTPIWKGGGVTFGPKPRDYRRKLPKKASRLAFRRAFSEKVAAGQVTVIENFSMTEIKTKQFNETIKKFDISTKKTLLVIDQSDRYIALSARNIPSVEVTIAKDLNTYQLLQYSSIIITQPAMIDLENRLKSTVRRGG